MDPWSLPMTTSTRRLRNRPSRVSLLATGNACPYPRTNTRGPSTPASSNARRTEAARSSESSWFCASLPTLSVKAFDRDFALRILAQELCEPRHQTLAAWPKRRAVRLEQDVVQRDHRAPIGTAGEKVAKLAFAERASLASRVRSLLRGGSLLLRDARPCLRFEHSAAFALGMRRRELRCLDFIVCFNGRIGRDVRGRARGVDRHPRIVDRGRARGGPWSTRTPGLRPLQ